MDYTGKKIEKYIVKRLIGEGGMASVYEAEHEVLGTKAAIKILNPVLTANPDFRERFMNEAKMMASFQHTNITKIIDFEETDTFLAIIMEYLEGQDLSELIESGAKLSDKEITSIFEQTLSAFQYAHEKGVIHRDIKPSNIYLLPNGKVKILDFGIAKLFGQGNEKTQAGTQMGTPIYMSPEQVKADKSIDHRSDIYSLGVTLYFALNGKSPYDSDGASQFDIFNKIVYEPLPELAGESPLIALVKKACQKDRDQRYQSCEEWLEDLKKFVDAKNETLVAEKTIKPTPNSDKTIFEQPASEKTAFDSNLHEKTKVEINSSQKEESQYSKKEENSFLKPKKNKVLLFSILGIVIIILIAFSAYFIYHDKPSACDCLEKLSNEYGKMLDMSDKEFDEKAENQKNKLENDSFCNEIFKELNRELQMKKITPEEWDKSCPSLKKFIENEHKFNYRFYNRK